MVKVDSLCKSFGPIMAVDNLTFTVLKGEILGLLGPNGAGKSTTMKILTGFLSPSSGDAFIMGSSVVTDTLNVQKHLGYIPENAPLYGEMVVVDFLRFIAEVRRIHPSLIADAIDRVVQLCALEEVYYRPIEALSKGYKKRVSMAQALIHDPPILILDEPTDGLDPNQKFEVRNLVKKLAKEKSIIIATHILEEVEAICSRAIIIASGRLLFDGSAEMLKQKSSSGRLDDVFRAITTGVRVEGVSI